jgi:hypothetical protein
MQRIFIDTSELMSSMSNNKFELAKRRSRWSSAPRLLTTCVFFGVLWLWFNMWTPRVLMPEDSFAYLQDRSFEDILNTTLGVCAIVLLLELLCTNLSQVREDPSPQPPLPYRPPRRNESFGSNLQHQTRIRARRNGGEYQRKGISTARREQKAFRRDQRKLENTHERFTKVHTQHFNRNRH